MKKGLKLMAIVFGLFALLVLLAPVLFKGSLEKLLLKNINQNLNASVSWESMDLNFYRNFPNASVKLNDFKVVNEVPFLGDTLAQGKALFIDMGLSQLFKGEAEPIGVNSLELEAAKINIKVDSLGNANYDIAKKSEESEAGSTGDNEQEGGFKFTLDDYEIRDSALNYDDQSTQTLFTIEQLNHSGSGDLSSELSTLATNSDMMVSLKIDETQFLSETPIKLQANFELDLKENKYTFLENKATINALPLEFEGSIQNIPDSTKVDLSFKTLSSDFKNFLAILPKAYVKEIENVRTTGEFVVNGTINGVSSATTIPKIDISIRSDNASFKYPSLPKSVQQITIDAAIKNTTGKAKDTYVLIGDLRFNIDDRPFRASGSFRNLTQNTIAQLMLNGSLDLSNLDQVLPMELDQELSGIFTANLKSNFDMESIDRGNYDNIKSEGIAQIQDFTYKDDYFKDAITISKANVSFTPRAIRLESMQATTGQTDMKAAGSIQNLIPWIMGKEDLRGRFSVTSEVFDMNDFTSEEVPNSQNPPAKDAPSLSTKAKESIKVPDFLDATLDFTAKKVIYDNLELENTSGTIAIRNETAKLSRVKSDALGGNIAIDGDVSTAQEIPTFAVDLKLNEVDLAQSFEKVSLIEFLAPIANALDGDLNTSISLAGQLNDKMTPVLESLTGSALAQIITAEVSSERSPVLAQMADKLAFLNVDKLTLRDLSTAIDFQDGEIIVKPFDFKVEDVLVKVAGSHKLDKSLAYKLNLDVPAKYLGSDATRLLQQLDPEQAGNMSVNVPVGISGSISNPKVGVDTQGAINQLTQQIIENQKDDLLEQGGDLLDQVLNRDTAKDSSATGKDNTKTDPIKDAVKDIFGNILSGRKKKKDSTNNNL